MHHDHNGNLLYVEGPLVLWKALTVALTVVLQRYAKFAENDVCIRWQVS